MYKLRVGDVPDRFHIHHKCENSACVNPRHLVGLSSEAHRAVYVTKDKTLKERIYRGKWEKIQAEKQIQAESERLVRERLEKQRLEEERVYGFVQNGWNAEDLAGRSTGINRIE